MIPRLHSFYGPADPAFGAWQRVPGYLLKCYVAMLPRLRAEEELAAIQRGHAFTDRPLEGRDRTSYVTQLQRTASGSRRPKMSKADIGVLTSMGVPVRMVGPAAKEKDRAA